MGRKLKDYSYLIGQKLDDWEIISVSKPLMSKNSKRHAQLRNSDGATKEVSLHNIIKRLESNSDRPYCRTTSTSVQNVSYSKWLNRYIVYMSRNGIRKLGSSKNLEEAIKIKERFVREFEKESVANG